MTASPGAHAQVDTREMGTISWHTTFQHLRQDMLRYRSEKNWLPVILIKNLYSHPSALGVINYRIGRKLWLSQNNPIVFLLWILARALYPLVRMYSGVELSPAAAIGPGLCILHFGPTIIHPGVVAGKNLTLVHGVTIGQARSGVPVIGDDVSVGAGATLLGGIHVGSRAQIGAGAVVTRDVPEYCLAIGIPAVSRPLE